LSKILFLRAVLVTFFAFFHIWSSLSPSMSASQRFASHARRLRR
jgi:hypothetical protein